jgi:hypothetical protein
LRKRRKKTREMTRAFGIPYICKLTLDLDVLYLESVALIEVEFNLAP